MSDLRVRSEPWLPPLPSGLGNKANRTHTRDSRVPAVLYSGALSPPLNKAMMDVDGQGKEGQEDPDRTHQNVPLSRAQSAIESRSVPARTRRARLAHKWRRNSTIGVDDPRDARTAVDSSHQRQAHEQRQRQRTAARRRSSHHALAPVAHAILPVRQRVPACALS